MYGAFDAMSKVSESYCDGKGSLQSIGSDLLTLRGYLDQLSRSSSEQGSLRESIKELRSSVIKKISEEQVRQSNLLEHLSGDKYELGEEQKREWQQLQSYVSQLYTLMEEEKDRLQPQHNPYLNTREGGDEPDWGENLLQALPLTHAAQAEGNAADLDDIQRDITDLLEIQSNLNRLVHGQGQDIDLIEANVGVAHMRVHRGQRALGKAAVLRSSSRKKKCCIAVCVLVAVAIPLIILAILVPILLHFLSSSS